ncbi:MAG: trypsin-like peptidase domain-containing protein [Rikenellaceae bacterium]
MKKVLFSIAMVAAAAIAGGVTAYSVAQTSSSSSGEFEDIQIDSKITNSVFGAASSGAVGSQFTAYSESSYPDLTYAAENAVRAVVGVEVTQQVAMSQRGSGNYDPFLEFFGIPQQQQRGGQQPQYREQKGGGSGVIISEDGYIVTNNHVVNGASKLRVKLYDGGTYDAKIIGVDPTTDIALIKIDKEGLPTLAMGSSNDLRLGEWVLAIGSPFDLQSTITAGIVSAKARQLDVIPGDFRIESFIQTDAAVNPGNSGGALVNSRGELVGINTLIKSHTGSYVGYSFAVPESIVRKVVTDLREFGVVQRAMLGVSFAPITDDFVEERGEELGIKKAGGVYVASVQDGGAASEAGIRKGDIITAIDGDQITSKVNLPAIIAMHRPGDKVKISVKRGETMKHFDVILRNKSGKAELVTGEQTDVAQILGGKLVDASQAQCRDLEIDGGVRVTSITEGGLLARARVRSGFIITHINDTQVLTLSDLNRLNESVRSIDGVYPDGRSASYHFVE